MKVTIWHAMVGFALIGAFLAVVVLIAYALYGPGITLKIPTFFRAGTSSPTVVRSNPLDGHSGVLFECSGDKALKAEFSQSSVRLVLSDGRELSLPQVISASLPAEASAQAARARYANPDESFVFWNKGGAAFIEENGTMTYANCVTR